MIFSIRFCRFGKNNFTNEIAVKSEQAFSELWSHLFSSVFNLEQNLIKSTAHVGEIIFNNQSHSNQNYKHKSFL